jgi:YihY family inner membrane protein
VPNWWRLPFKSLIFLAITVCMVFVGIVVSALAKMTQSWLAPAGDLSSWFHYMESVLIPLLAIFLSVSLFCKLAPRRPTRLAEVWGAAICVTVLLQAAESLFVIYLMNFATLNAVYGAFGGIMALLLWIHLFGCILIFGACLCVAQAERRPYWASPNDSLPAMPRRS